MCQKRMQLGYELKLISTEDEKFEISSVHPKIFMRVK